METVNKMMMAEALQECLSRFPKIKTLDKKQKEASKALISGKASLL